MIGENHAAPGVSSGPVAYGGLVRRVPKLSRQSNLGEAVIFNNY